MPIDTIPKHVLSYNGSKPLQMADEQTLISVGGNAITFTNLTTESQSFLMQSKPRKVAAIDFCWSASELAVTYREAHANILLYSYPNLKLLGKLSFGAEQDSCYEFLMIKFSRCGKRLVTMMLDNDHNRQKVGANRRKRICVWDLATQNPLKGCDRGSVNIDVEFMSFDPSNYDQIIVGGYDGLQLWKLHNGKVTYLLKPSLIPISSIDMKLSVAQQSELDLTSQKKNHHRECICHAWTLNSHVFIGNAAGELHLLDLSKNRHVHCVKEAERDELVPIVAIICTTEALILFYADGLLRWLSIENYTPIRNISIPVRAHLNEFNKNISNQGRNALKFINVNGESGDSKNNNSNGLHVGYNSKISHNVIASVCTSPKYTKAYVGTNDGKLFELKTIAGFPEDTDIYGEDDGSLGLVDAKESMYSARIESDNETPRPTTNIKPQYLYPIGSFHNSPILDAAVVTPFGGIYTSDVTLVTGGTNGRLYFWNLTTRKVGLDISLPYLFSFEYMTKCYGELSTMVSTVSEAALAMVHGPSQVNNDEKLNENDDTPLSGTQTSRPAKGITHDQPVSELQFFCRPLIITSIAGNYGDPVLAVGDNFGKLRFLYVSMVANGNGAIEVVPLHSVQLLTTQIDRIVVHPLPTHQVLLVASTESNTVFVISMDHIRDFQVLAYLQIPKKNELIVDLKWTPVRTSNDASNSGLNFLSFTVMTSSYNCYVSSLDNLLYEELHLQDEHSSYRKEDSSPKQLACNCVGSVVSPEGINISTVLFFLQSPQNVMISASPKSGDLHVLKYNSPKGRDIPKDGDGYETSDIMEIHLLVPKAHDDGISVMAVYPRQLRNGTELIATATNAGLISLWVFRLSPTPGTLSQALRWQDIALGNCDAVRQKTIASHLGTVTSLTFVTIHDEICLISTGNDASILIWELHISSELRPRPLIDPPLSNPSNSVPVNIEPLDCITWIPIMNSSYANIPKYAKVDRIFHPERENCCEPFLNVLENEQNAIIRSEFNLQKDTSRKVLHELKGRLCTLLEENSSLPDDEKLPIADFVINLPWRNTLQQKNVGNAVLAKNVINRDIIRMKILHSRLKEEFWDSAIMQGTSLYALSDPDPVDLNKLHLRSGNPSSTTPGSISVSTISDSQNLDAKKKRLRVFNFPLRRLEPIEERRLKQIMFLRIIEIEASRDEKIIAASTGHTSWITNADQHSNNSRDTSLTAVTRYEHVVGSPHFTWLVNTGQFHPAKNQWINSTDLLAITNKAYNDASGINSAVGDKTSTGGNSNASKGASGITISTSQQYNQAVAIPALLNDIQSYHLMYSPIVIKTRKQQRIQIYLVKSFTRALQIGYNAEFTKLATLKEQKIEEIEAKNRRIEDIWVELAGENPDEQIKLRHSQQWKELYRPKWEADEKASSILTVGEHERKHPKYETEQVRAQKAKEAEDKKRQEALQKENDVAGRALIDMMNGTLEVKKENIVSQTLIKENWMIEIPREDMTTEQKVALALFETAESRLREEQEKYKKLLDLELKQLKSDITGICKQVDDKLKLLDDMYKEMRMNILVQELYTLRLAEDLLEQESLRHQCKQVMDKLDSVGQEFQKSESDLVSINSLVENLKTDWHKTMEEDRLMERNFTKELDEIVQADPRNAVQGQLPVSLDHETVKIIQQLYKMRRTESHNDNTSLNKSKRGHGISGLSSGYSSLGMSSAQQRILAEAIAVSSNSLTLPDAQSNFSLSSKNLTIVDPSYDPFQSTGSENSSKPKIIEKDVSNTSRLASNIADTFTRNHRNAVPLDYMHDCPEGVSIDQRVWDALNILRTKKILLECKLRDKADELAQVKSVAEEYRKSWECLRAVKAQLNRKNEEILEKMSVVAVNKPLLVHVKQGQDESHNTLDVLHSNAVASTKVLSQTLLASSLVITSPEEARQEPLLVSRNSVEGMNAIIQRHGRDQVTILNKIKNFRKNINIMEWEHSLLGMQINDMNERYVDIQLLRVTKDLQELFQTGDNTEKQKREVNLLEAKLTQLGSQRQINMDKNNQSVSKLVKLVASRHKENIALTNKVHELRMQVQIREDIARSRAHANGEDMIEMTDTKKHKKEINKPIKSIESKRLKAITVRRKLVDLAKAQTSEIEYLRMELDKMRRRTFPSFVRQQVIQDYKKNDM